MLDIFVHVTRPRDVLHQIRAVGFQRPVNAFEHVERTRLIVNGVEARDQLEPFGLGTNVEIAQVHHDEREILPPGACRSVSRVIDRVGRKVYPHEVTVGKQFSQPADYAPAPATDVEDANALRQALP
jgi:hypothetical protein